MGKEGWGGVEEHVGRRGAGTSGSTAVGYEWGLLDS